MSDIKVNPSFNENSTKIEKIAEDAGCISSVKEIFSYKDKIFSEKKVVVVSGGSNTGKSSLINLILAKDILPVSVTANLDKKVTIEETKEDEKVKCNDDNIVELSEFIGKKKKYFEEFNSFNYEIKDEWMEKSEIKIIEASNSEFSRGKGKVGLPNIVREADYLIYIVSSLMPLTKADIETITLCVLNGIPCKIFLSKLDLIETQEEKDEVIEYVKNQFNQLFEDVVATPINLSNISKDDSDKLSKSIKEWVDSINLEELRNERLNLLLVEGLNEIRLNADIMAEKTQKNVEEGTSTLKAKQDEFELQRFKWNKLEQEMVEHRLNLRDKLRTKLEMNIESISDILVEQMKNSPDFKLWWDKSMPSLIEHEITNLSSKMSNEINERIEEDQKWLVDEVNKSFNLNIDVVRSSANLDADILLQNNEINLKKPNKWMVVSGAGVVVAIASAITLSPPGIAIGAAAGIAGYSMNKMEKDENKELIKREILKYVNGFCKKYVDQIDKQLKQIYDNMIKELKEYSVKWQSEQISILQSKGTSSISDKPEFWEDIKKQCDDISIKIYQA